MKFVSMKYETIYYFISFLIVNSVGQNYRSPPGVPPRPQQQYEAESNFKRSPQYDRSPPGVPPRQMHQNAPAPPPGGDIKFHDPSEYQKSHDTQKKVEPEVIKQAINNQHPPEQPNDNTNHFPGHQSKHKAHSHGMGQEIDAEHMKQHNKKEYVDISKMSEAELAVHHFRQYDLDDNGRVDGLEIYKKIQMDAAEHGEASQSEDDWGIVIKVVDNALHEYDENKDGVIYYSEFYKAYKKL